MRTIFQLNNVTVEFDKHSLTRRSLRESLAAKLNGDNTEKVIALKNISLKIYEGEHIGIIGRNGAGKSTLLKVLTRVITPESGIAHIDYSRHIIPLLELGIGFQAELSGRENCLLAGLLMGYTKQQIENKIDDIINFAELADFIDDPVKNYSSGMYARLAFAIATDIKPEILLVDEVFGVGDEFFMRKCLARMHNLMNLGLTTIFVAHNIDFLVENCNRLIWLEKGQILMDGNPSDVASEYRNYDSPIRLMKAQ